MKKVAGETVEEMLKNAGFRVTEHRLALLKTIASQKLPVTVQTLFDILRKKYAIDQATIYRNLSSLHEAGLLRRLDFNHGHAHYELETGNPSSQFVCGKCEMIEKLNSKELDDLIKRTTKKTKKFNSLSSYTIEVYGICKQCVQ